VFDTHTFLTESSEYDELSHVVTASSCLELECGPQSTAFIEQSTQIPGVLSYGVLAGGSEKTTDHDSSLTVSDCVSCDTWTKGPATECADSKGPSSPLIALFAAANYSELEPPQCGSLDVEAVNTSVGLPRMPLSQEPDCQCEVENDTSPLSTIECCDDNNVHEGIPSYDPEAYGDDETFDYTGIDWEPKASGVHTPNTTLNASPHSSLEPQFEHPRTPSNAEPNSVSSSLSTLALERPMVYAQDDIRLKCKIDAKFVYNTKLGIKCASTNDLKGMLELVLATRGMYSSQICINMHPEYYRYHQHCRLQIVSHCLLYTMSPTSLFVSSLSKASDAYSRNVMDTTH